MAKISSLIFAIKALPITPNVTKALGAPRCWVLSETAFLIQTKLFSEYSASRVNPSRRVSGW